MTDTSVRGAGTDKANLDRRQFLRRVAATSAAAAWAAPVIQSIAATPAYADAAGTPVAQCYLSSTDVSQSCMDTCHSVCGSGDAAGGGDDGGSGDTGGGGKDTKEPEPSTPIDLCGSGPCASYCNIAPGGQCPNTNFCNPSCFQCNDDSVTFVCATA